MVYHIPMIFAQNIHFYHWNKTQTYHGNTASFPSDHPSGWLGIFGGLTNQFIWVKHWNFDPKKLGIRKV
jgi:membrane-associated phospholipid phosphatase